MAKRKPKRVYNLGGDIRIEVFKPRNPVENLIGGEVRIRRKKEKVR